ncbi:uncharacterized protein BO96DRAFT_202586 [Aspergillus niger CBS 101883]|uniref:uncharacterized protein n=1 Tax=Aspergillus lacticoffeatus (strain CBS 101883) TaxID=1450533 RepID=UPI000D802322|nr:uncharacterized protein BO96DRAFT_202586 [Aspergillus niger CBS 101883]PYH50958.1 hypothetical protein BO96DRAFT_202586 [Aspergillus niger CBS 101883]
MSAFLFYRPNSNPNRYSRRERFSPRCTKSTPSAHTIIPQPSIKVTASPVMEPYNLSDRNNLDLCCRDNAHCPQVQPTNDSCSATSDKDRTSFHGPFPGPQIGRELVGTAMADNGHDDAASISNQSTIERNTSGRNSLDEPALAPASVDRDIDHVSFCQQSREAPPTPERQCFSPSSDQAHARHTLEGISKNNDFQPGIPLTLAEFAPPNAVNRSSLEDWGFHDETLQCRNSLHQDRFMLEADNFHLHDITASDFHSPRSDRHGSELFPLHESPGLTDAPFLNDQGHGIDDEYLDPSPHRPVTPVRSMSEVSDKDHCTATDDDEDVLDPLDDTHEDYTTSADAQSLPSPGRYGERAFGGRRDEGSSKLSPNAESHFSHKTKGIDPAIDTAREGDRPISMSKSPTSTESEKKYVEFSHVEISTTSPRTLQPRIPFTKGHVVDQTCCHAPLSRGPWRLDGIILSIDIREAQRIPIRAGTSTVRVLDGQLFQTITMSLGAVDTTSKPANFPRVTRKRGVSAARGRLTSERKRYLVRLRDTGYSWNQISAKFPGRKKENLQAAYYRELKGLQTQVSQPLERTSSSHTRSKGSGNSESPKPCQVKRTRCSRYNLRRRSDR